MKILDAIKALKGDFETSKKDLAAEKEAHIVTMTERDDARAVLLPVQESLEATLTRAEAAEAVIAEAAEALGIEAVVEAVVPKVAPKK